MEADEIRALANVDGPAELSETSVSSCRIRVGGGGGPEGRLFSFEMELARRFWPPRLGTSNAAPARKSVLERSLKLSRITRNGTL